MPVQVGPVLQQVTGTQILQGSMQLLGLATIGNGIFGGTGRYDLTLSGAAGNGTTDDTAKIQVFLNSLAPGSTAVAERPLPVPAGRSALGRIAARQLPYSVLAPELGRCRAHHPAQKPNPEPEP